MQKSVRVANFCKTEPLAYMGSVACFRPASLAHMFLLEPHFAMIGDQNIKQMQPTLLGSLQRRDNAAEAVG